MDPKYKPGDIVTLKGKDAILNGPTLFKFYQRANRKPGQFPYENEHALVAIDKCHKAFKVLKIFRDSAGHLYELEVIPGLPAYFHADENWIQ